MKVFITGANGFMGTNLIDLLLKRGYEITAFVLKGTGTRNIQKKGVTILEGNIVERASFSKQLKGHDAVVHLAAYVNDIGHIKNFFEINLKGTKNLIEESLKKKVQKFIFISSITVYGEKNLKTHENSVEFSNNLYALSKIAAEELVNWYHEKKQLKTIILRPGLIPFGPYDMLSLPSVLKTLKTGFFPLVGGGENMISTTYIENFCHAIELALRNKDASGEDFDITDNEKITLKNFLETVSRISGIKARFINFPPAPLIFLAKLSEKIFKNSSPISTYRIGLSRFDRYVSSIKAKKILHYTPIVSFYEGMKKTLLWYKSQGLI